MTKYIESACPSCRRPIRVRVEYLGKKLECKTCGQIYVARSADGTPEGKLILEAEGNQPLSIPPPSKPQSSPPKSVSPAPTLEQELQILRKELNGREVALQSYLQMLRDTQGEFTRVNERLEKTLQERDEAQSRAAQAGELEARHRADLEQMQQLLQALETRAAESEQAAAAESQARLAELQQVRAEHERLQASAQRLEQQLASQPPAESVTTAAADESAPLRAELDRLRAHDAEQVAETQRLGQRNQELEAQLATLATRPPEAAPQAPDPELQQLRAQHERLLNEEAALRREYETASAELQALRAAAKTRDSRRDQAAKETAKLAALQGEHENTLRELEALRGQLSDAQGECSKFSAELAALRAAAEELPALRSHDADTAAQLAALQADHEREQRELETIRGELGGARGEVEQLQALRAELDDLLKQHAEVSAERDGLRASTGAAQALHERVVREIEELRGQLNATRTEADHLRAMTGELIGIRKQHATVSAERDTLRTTADELQKRVADLESAGSERDKLRGEVAGVHALRTEVEQLRIKEKRAVSDLERVREQLTAANAKVEESKPLQALLATRQAECAAVQKEAADALQTASQLEQTLAESQQRLTDANLAIQHARQEGQAELERARREWAVERRRLELDLEQELRDQAQALEAQIRDEQNRATEAWQTAQTEIQQARAEFDRQLVDSREQVTAAGQERDHFREEREGLNRQIDELREKCNAHEAEKAAEMSRLTGDLQKVALERDAAAADQRDLADKLHHLESELAGLKDREKEFQSEMARMRQALSQTRQQRDAAAQVHAELQEQMQALQAQIEESQVRPRPPSSMDMTLDVLQAQLKVLTTERDEWRHRLATAEREFDEERQALHFQVDRLQKQIVSMRQVLQGLGIHT